MLVVEDTLPVARALTALLERHGYTVCTARGIEEAHRLLNEEVNWVLLDLSLPDGQGEQLLVYIRRRGISAQVTVLTGVSDSSRLEALRRMSPCRVLHKPCDARQVLESIGADRIALARAG